MLALVAPTVTLVFPLSVLAESRNAANRAPLAGLVVDVATVQELSEALGRVQPGTTVRVAPGTYPSGFSLRDVKGSPDAPVVLQGADPEDPPVFTGHGEGAKLSSCAYVKLSDLKFVGFGSNGVNVDDGGSEDSPSHHIRLENLQILGTGPTGNNDALKMSGVGDFVVRNCRFEGWGGSGIDLVGCHRGVVENCLFLGVPGYRTKNAVQIKGGSSSILVQTSFFRNAGERVVCIGGSTGLAYFRPAPEGYEAREITVAGNRFSGGEAQIAWITSRDSHVHHNLFHNPEKWLGRILQETKDTKFQACGGALFEDNLVVTDDRVRAVLNRGKGTDPTSFTFRRNAWYRPASGSKPDLPTPEIEGVYGVDPELQDVGTPQMSVGAQDGRLRGIGLGAYVAWREASKFADIEIVPVPRVSPPAPGYGRRLALLGCAAVVLAGVVLVLRGRFENRSESSRR